MKTQKQLVDRFAKEADLGWKISRLLGLSRESQQKFISKFVAKTEKQMEDRRLFDRQGVEKYRTIDINGKYQFLLWDWNNKGNQYICTWIKKPLKTLEAVI